MTEATHQPVFDRLADLREALRAAPSPDAGRLSTGVLAP